MKRVYHKWKRGYRNPVLKSSAYRSTIIAVKGTAPCARLSEPSALSVRGATRRLRCRDPVLLSSLVDKALVPRLLCCLGRDEIRLRGEPRFCLISDGYGVAVSFGTVV